MNNENESACHDRLRESVLAEPSIFGRLLAVSAWRNPATNQYEHPLASTFGAGAVNAALLQIHREIFESWLCLSLKGQEQDLSIWLVRSRSDDEPAVLLERIRRGLKNLLPPDHIEAERKLFRSNFEMIMAFFKNRSA